jgi:uncharacterized protein (TIGR02145 family)
MRLTYTAKIILLVVIGVGTLAVAYYMGIEKGKRAPISLAPTHFASPAPSIAITTTPSPIQTPTPYPTLTPTATSSICPPTVTDVDNYIYNTVKIGSQCWMKQNLKVTKNPEGKEITRYCYNGDPKICDTDGGLYDWNTTMNSSTTEGAQGISPNGWHIPRDSEWYELEKGLAMDSCESNRKGEGCAPVGTKLKRDGSSGFEATFAGFHDPNGSFYNRDANSFLWSSTENDSKAWDHSIDLILSTIGRYSSDKMLSFSVRCLRD